jgi:hypothetical protein
VRCGAQQSFLFFLGIPRFFVHALHHRALRHGFLAHLHVLHWAGVNHARITGEACTDSTLLPLRSRNEITDTGSESQTTDKARAARES